MGLFHRRKDSDKAEEDRELIAKNASYVDVLITIAKGNAECEKELEKLKEKIKYLQSSEDKHVLDMDYKIKSSLEDFKISMTKLDNKDKLDIAALKDGIKDIEVLISERGVKI